MKRARILPFFTSGVTTVQAAVLSPRSGSPNDRSWQAAVQDINGIISIITLLPVLTGKAQNIKLIASRIIPGSFIMAGIGAGRVLAKLQVGILLCSFDLYRNTIGDLSYPHDEYVNKFSPVLDHIPSHTPERHANGAYINHNLSEGYMVEAWFQTQGLPAVVELHQNNYSRMLMGFILYIFLYTGETFLSVRNAAIGTSTVFIVIQIVSVSLWLFATALAQVRKGQGKREVELNDIQSSTYRCFRLPVLGSHVSTTLLSFHLNNLQGYQLFKATYEQSTLIVAGSMMLLSGILDMLSTVLIVGKTTWAYPWVAVELIIILAKIFFCVEPLRQMEILKIKYQSTGQDAQLPKNTALELPLDLHLASDWQCVRVTTHFNVIQEQSTGGEWKSSTAGLSIGQVYSAVDGRERTMKYLALVEHGKKLGLVDEAPEPQSNHSLQREFLAALAAVVSANKIPSREFVEAVETMMSNIQSTMPKTWWKFGTKDLQDGLATAKVSLLWRKWL